MRENINKLESILINLKCKFADSIYDNFLKEKYSLNICDEDLNSLKENILILESKIKLLKLNFPIFLEKTGIKSPYKLSNTDILNFFEKEQFLTECNKKYLEKIL